MHRKRIKEIKGVDVTNVSFGIKKQVVATVAEKEDVERFIALVNEKHMIWRKAIERAREQALSGFSARPKYRDLAPIDSQMRGIRKLWRNAYTDSFSSGLYKCTSNLDWQVGACAGELGTAWTNARVPKDTLFMYVQHDRLGNVELVDAKTSRVIKLNRGHSVCDRFIKIQEGEQDE
ncbi:MAG: hypothetical protein CBB97_00455 [Candidatus Endolissoclinum sp. TMED37]|nr:MAG: hypothetical protein CBB97_00455 [Candidatus Endolissoclinum sp. TMED37]